MSPILQDKLLDLLVNFLAIILGGGLITLIIEWRRHQRETRNWQREDETIQIDIPRCDTEKHTWKIATELPDKMKLMIYENHLENTIRRIVVVAEFVIRNTTAAEIVITRFDAEIPNLPFGVDIKSFYDLETFDLISDKQMGAMRLKPFGSIARALMYVANFDKDRKLDSPPESLSISVTTSNGKIVQGMMKLKYLPKLADVVWEGGEFFPMRYYEKHVRIPEDNIPF